MFFKRSRTYVHASTTRRMQAVTAADVKRVANKYLGADRVVLSIVPLGKTELASHADKSTVVTVAVTEADTTSWGPSDAD